VTIRHPYWAKVEAGMFAQLAALQPVAHSLGLTMRTCGSDTQPKRFKISRKPTPEERRWSGNGRHIVVRDCGSIREVEAYLRTARG
jgi:hypothetical protein